MASLKGLCVLVTRPEGQNQALAALLQKAAADVLIMPSIQIQAVAPDIESVLGKTNDMIIFISRNAVRHGLPILSRCGGLLKQAKIVAVGKQTAQALSELGCSIDVVSEKNFSTEALLVRHELQAVQCKTILIVRGQGGREKLAVTLRERGANVRYLEVYRRILPKSVNSMVMAMGQKRQIDSIVTTSNEGLQNLVALCAYAPWVFLTQLLVFSQRGADLARTLGFIRPALVVSEPSNKGILEALLQWKNSEKNAAV